MSDVRVSEGEASLAAPALSPLFEAAGEMAERMQRIDWASSPLGSPSDWPVPLQTLLQLLLRSAQPMFMAWGPKRVWFYNDAFIPILGRKHPEALGRPSAEVWAEAWIDLEPMFNRVFRGESVHMDDINLQLDRNGKLEEAHFSFSYNPVSGDGRGRFDGLFGVCTETTGQVLATRRLSHATQRQRAQFEQAPGFISVLAGPQHVFEFVNQAYVRLVGRPDLVGMRVRDAFPDL